VGERAGGEADSGAGCGVEKQESRRIKRRPPPINGRKEEAGALFLPLEARKGRE
jgi:hypothetical protein